MTQKNEYRKEKAASASLIKRMLLGGGIGLLLISIFLVGTGEPDAEWRRFWMIRPLIVVPLAGALGGLCNYYLINFHNLAGFNKTAAIVLSIIIYVIGLWLGFVLGLDGTLWD